MNFNMRYFLKFINNNTSISFRKLRGSQLLNYFKIQSKVYMSNEPSKVTKQVFFPNYSTYIQRVREISSSQMKIVERSFQITNYSLSSRRKGGECNVFISVYVTNHPNQHKLGSTMHTPSFHLFISTYIFFTFCPSLSYKAANEIYPLHHSSIDYSIVSPSHTHLCKFGTIFNMISSILPIYLL